MVLAGLQVACEAHIQGGKVLGAFPLEKWEFRPSSELQEEARVLQGKH